MADDFSPLAYTLAGQRRNPYDRRRAYAQQIMQSGIDYSPVQHPLQGVARLAQALVGGWMGREIDRDEEAATKKQQDAFATAMSEVDPQKRIAMIAAVDPALGARLSGALAVKQAELAQQQELRQRQGNDWAAGFGQGGPQTAMPPGGAPPSSATPAPLPSGTVAGGNPGFQNNVGNLRVSPAAWEGKGTPHNGFETFATPQQGVNAAFKNLEAYGRANPQMTVAQAIARWAPPNENDTQGYIKRLSESTGINPGMPLVEVLKDPAVAATLLDGITRIEKGGLPPGVTADTFMTATRGAPPQAVQPVQLAQGSADANGTPLPPQVQGAPPPPQAPGNMPAVTPPAIPDVPRPAPNPQTVARLRQMIATGQATPQQAEQHLQQEIDRDWNVARERAKMEFDQRQGDYRSQREREAKAPQESFNNASKLRDDFRAEPVTKAYRVVVPMLESAKDAINRPTRAADLNLIYAFAKLMDPDSVVRESETGMVVASGTVADRLGGLIGQLNGGQMLQPETRQRLIAELESRFRSLEESYLTLEGSYRDIAKSGGINPDHVILPIRGKGAARSEGNQPSQDELKRWSQGGQTGDQEPVYDMSGRRIK